jgi:drug/metabolite transporter (DMT)-like permease
MACIKGKILISKYKPHLFSIITIFFFSTIEVVGKLIGAEISAYAITAWRFLIGGVLLLPLAIRETRQSKQCFTIKELGGFGMAGILNVCLSMLFLQLSIFYGRANLSAVIISSNPLFVMIFAYLLLKEKITRLQVFSLLLGLIGLLLFIVAEGEALRQSLNLELGVVFGLSAALTFALSTVYSKRLIFRHGNIVALCFVFLSGSLALFIYGGLNNEQMLFDLSGRNLLMIGYLGLFVTGIAYLFYFAAIRVIGAAKASMYFLLKPAIACTLAWLIRGETLKLTQVIAIILIMLSLSREGIIRKIMAIKGLTKSALN